MFKKFSFRDFDWTLLALVLMICAVGVTEIYSATLHTKFADSHLWLKQIYWVLGGMLLMFIVSMIDYHKLLDTSHWLYLASIMSLLAVAVFGRRYLGAKRWIMLPGGQHFQPSEWVKLILIIVLAKYFADHVHEEAKLSDVVKAGIITVVPFALVLRQPDLGTALTYVPVIVMALFLGGIRFKHAAVLILVFALILPAFWHGADIAGHHLGMKAYQKQRLTTFLNPDVDSQGSGYQINQSLIAVGSGGIWGKGVAKGTQTQGAFLPVPQTDFIFAALAEEHGFVGALLLLLLYFVMLMRLIHNAQTAPDRAGTFLVMGVVAVLVFHLMVNVGMVVGFMPVTGIPLPLMSYGGSSILFAFLALGMVNNIRMRRFVN
jgi:rod shape determining protein RodA